MNQCKTPSWFAEKLKYLAQTGKLNLSGEAFDDLSFVGSRPSMKQLDISFTPIQTIEGLQLQSKLDSLIADSSELVNFKNFRAVQKISSISLKNTPVSHLPNFKLSLLIVIGPSLRVINGQYISTKLREKATQYPPIASDLVNCGWIAEYPCPNESDMEKIIQSYGLGDIEEDLDEPLENFQQQAPIDFEKTVDYYTSVHKRVIQQAHQQIKNASLDFEPFQLPPFEKDTQEDDKNSFLNGLAGDVGLNLCDKVQILLHRHGYTVSQKNRTESMISILSELLELDLQESLIEEEDEISDNRDEDSFLSSKLNNNKKAENNQVESKHNNTKAKTNQRNENRPNNNKQNDDMYFEIASSESKQAKINHTNKKSNQNNDNENIKQTDKYQSQKQIYSINQNQVKENNKSNEKKPKSSNHIENEKRESRFKKNELIDNKDYYENDNSDHLDDSYNDNSNSNYNNSFDNNYNINDNNNNDNDYNDDDYDYEEFNDKYINSKKSKDYASYNHELNKNIKDMKNDNNSGYDNDLDEEEEYETHNDNSRDYFNIKFSHEYRIKQGAKKKKDDLDIDNENTEKEVDINFDSITKEQMSTSGIDKKFFELADRCSSQSDIPDKDFQGDDLKWKEFVAQLENE